MNKIRHFRQLQGLQLKDLVISTGLSMGHLSHLENGNKEPSKAAMEAIAKALSRTVPEIFYPDYTAEELAALTVKEGGSNAKDIQVNRRTSRYANG